MKNFVLQTIFENYGLRRRCIYRATLLNSLVLQCDDDGLFAFTDGFEYGRLIHSEMERGIAGTEGSGWELRHLAGSPGGGGVIRLCHTLARVNTV